MKMATDYKIVPGGWFSFKNDNNPVSMFPDRESLDINLAKVSSLLLHAIHIPFFWRILQKTILVSGV